MPYSWRLCCAGTLDMTKPLIHRASPRLVTILVGVIAALYLLVAAFVAWAYGSVVDNKQGIAHLVWSNLPLATPLYFVPGAMLAVMAIFLRQNRWAVLCAAILVATGIPEPLSRMLRFIMYHPHFYLSRSSYMRFAIVATILITQIYTLVLLLRQWHHLKSLPLAPGSGFEVIALTSTKKGGHHSLMSK